MEIREKFINNLIPYDKLDKGIIPLIDILNFKLNIKTKFCCFGHGSHDEISVMFDESITEEQIMELAKYLQSKGILMFQFNKCVRPVFNDIAVNWTFASINQYTLKNRRRFMRELIKVLNEHEI
jgi:hypothetical protein